MRARVAASVLAGVALVCAVFGAGYAYEVLHYYYQVESSSMGLVIVDAMGATILLVLAGCAVLGLLVLRGVAEMLDQALGASGQNRPSVGTSDAGATAEEKPIH